MKSTSTERGPWPSSFEVVGKINFQRKSCEQNYLPPTFNLYQTVLPSPFSEPGLAVKNFNKYSSQYFCLAEPLCTHT
jgi:hypothetical protein